MKEFLPYYAVSPNKILYFYDEPFDDGYGHKAMVTKVVYIDTKKKITHIATAHVVWSTNEN